MAAGDVSNAAFDRAGSVLKRALTGISADQIRQQPAGPESNPIGWLSWHLTRVHDRTFSTLLGKPELWSSDGWAERFKLSAETGTGGRNTLDEVRAFDPISPDNLLAYWEAVRDQRSRPFLEGLADSDLDTPTPGEPVMPPNETIKIAIARVTSDAIQHIGQIAYARGLVDRHGWYGA